MRRQRLEPKCIAMDYHYSDSYTARWEYVFENEDYVLKQYGWHNPHVTVEDHWSGEVLASSSGTHGGDAVSCAEEMMQNAHGNISVSKETVEQIIYKLMIGDIVLMNDED